MLQAAGFRQIMDVQDAKIIRSRPLAIVLLTNSALPASSNGWINFASGLPGKLRRTKEEIFFWVDDYENGDVCYALQSHPVVPSLLIMKNGLVRAVFTQIPTDEAIMSSWERVQAES